MDFSDYSADKNRYNKITYRRCGISGIQLPAISIGMWHNFGHSDNFDNARDIVRKAFDLGVTHFDLANNYGPPYGSAEENVGKILKKDFQSYRDEILISSKAGYDMWPGPYGIGGSRKYIIASCEQSLKRLGLDYIDIFYSHRFDTDTPLDETMGALDTLVKQGKALYAGISNYNPEQTILAAEILSKMGTPCLIHQTKYSMFYRTPEDALLKLLKKTGIGAIAYSPLAQGLLSDRYLKGIPIDSRIAKPGKFLTTEHLSKEILEKIRKLNSLAKERKQTLAQMAIAWILRNEVISSVLVGVSSSAQLSANIEALERLDFNEFELKYIEDILKP